MKFGMAIAARIPMIATTIISSIKVKPRASLTRRLDHCLPLLPKRDRAIFIKDS
jgi:hypothetical protein